MRDMFKLLFIYISLHKVDQIMSSTYKIQDNNLRLNKHTTKYMLMRNNYIISYKFLTETNILVFTKSISFVNVGINAEGS